MSAFNVMDGRMKTANALRRAHAALSTWPKAAT